MFKSGLASLRGNKQTLLEQEIAKEQSAALGKAGERLKAALEGYNADKAARFQQHSQAWHHQQLTDAVYNLMLTREFLGFVDSNLEWICQQYQLPRAVLQQFASDAQLARLSHE
ncbi:hypothetical protein [Shewanella sp. YIC-542]|uniref:hypothetical protein n=1 Tax=Shewanella mytili TaxID=3377111 RepID=UPI00398F804D